MPQSDLGVHEKIIWVPPLRIADEVKVTNETKRVLKMSIKSLKSQRLLHIKGQSHSTTHIRSSVNGTVPENRGFLEWARQ